MKRKMLHIPMLALLVGIMLSCSNKENAEGGSDAKAKSFAENYCKLAKEIGFNSEFKLTEDYMNSNGDKMEEKFYANSEKLISIMKEMDTHIKTLNDEQKQQFTKNFLKAVIDTECSNLFLKEIPYSKMEDGIKELEEQIARDKKRKNNPEPVVEDYVEEDYAGTAEAYGDY